MQVNDDFSTELSSFIKNNKLLCVLTLGLAVVGYSIGNLSGRTISWMGECFGTTQKTDFVAKNTLISKSKEISESSLLLSPNQKIEDSKLIELPNYTTVHINKNGEVFYLTPIGGNNIHQYQEAKLDDYTKACIEIDLGMAYNESGYLVKDDKIYDHSIAEKKEALQSKEHTVNLWIQACHFIIVKSDQGRYWFLHYDPGQAKHQYNQIGGLKYPRPNYSDLKPTLPYNLEGVGLNDDEKLQVLVVHPSRKYNINDVNNLTKGEFDSKAFKDFVGEDRVTSIKTICYKSAIDKAGDYQIEIDFNTKTSGLSIFLKGERDKPLYSSDNLF